MVRLSEFDEFCACCSQSHSVSCRTGVYPAIYAALLQPAANSRNNVRSCIEAPNGYRQCSARGLPANSHIPDIEHGLEPQLAVLLTP